MAARNGSAQARPLRDEVDQFFPTVDLDADFEPVQPQWLDNFGDLGAEIHRVLGRREERFRADIPRVQREARISAGV